MGWVLGCLLMRWKMITLILTQVGFFCSWREEESCKTSDRNTQPQTERSVPCAGLFCSIFLSVLLIAHHCIKLLPPLISCSPNALGVEFVLFPSLVPDDVFAPNYIWKGSYNYRGRKQPMTLSITSFNSTTGRVNVSLSNGNMELLLSGMFPG